jgi:hypothetical protein
MGAPEVSELKDATIRLAHQVDANLAEFRSELRALNEVMVERTHAALQGVERVEAKVDTLKDREELISVTATADRLLEERNHEREAKENAIEQARSWKQEANTYQGIVRDIQDALGIADAAPGFEVSHIREAIGRLQEKPTRAPEAPPVTFAVVTRVADAKAGNAGNLAVGEAYHVDPANPLSCKPIAPHLAPAFRVPVFTKGEILVLDSVGREVAGELRRPDKWDVETRAFNTLAAAIAYANGILRPGETT